MSIFCRIVCDFSQSLRKQILTWFLFTKHDWLPVISKGQGPEATGAGSPTFFRRSRIAFCQRHSRRHGLSLGCFLNEPAEVMQTSLISLRNKHDQHTSTDILKCSRTQQKQKTQENVNERGSWDQAGSC